MTKDTGPAFIILDMSDPDFVKKFKEAIGFVENDTLTITTPQLEREDGKLPIQVDKEIFATLHTKTKEELTMMGLRLWDTKNGLMLFPYQWYDNIPDGFMVHTISDEVEVFKCGETDNDYRYGCLAYGIIPDYAKQAKQ